MHSASREMEGTKTRDVRLYSKVPSDVRAAVRAHYEKKATGRDEKRRAEEAAFEAVVGGSKKGRITDFLGDEAKCKKGEADDSVYMFFVGCRIPEHHADNPLWRNMVRAINYAGSGYVAPRRRYVGGAGLKLCRTGIEKERQPIAASWKRDGVTVSSDMMTDRNGRPQANVMLINDSGAVFVEAINCKMESKTGGFIASLLLPIIEKVGPEKRCRPLHGRGLQLQGRLQGAHGGVTAHRVRAVRYARARPPDGGRGPYPVGEGACGSGGRHDQLRPQPPVHPQLPEEWGGAGRKGEAACEAGGDEVRHELHRPLKAVQAAVHIGSDVAGRGVRQLGDGGTEADGGYLPRPRHGRRMVEECNLTEDMNTKLEAGEKIPTRADAAEIGRIVRRRWDESLACALHVVGWILNPANQEEGIFCNDVECTRILKAFIARHYDGSTFTNKDGEEKRASLVLQEGLTAFLTLEGSFGNPEAIADREAVKAGKHSMVQWWGWHGTDHPHLTSLACRALTQPVSASPCERGWVTWELVHTARRNKLGSEKLRDLVYVAHNWHVVHKYHKRAESLAVLPGNIPEPALPEGYKEEEEGEEEEEEEVEGDEAVLADEYVE
ncbi:unnamed protein product [Closterium sp. NIES-53]